MLWRMCWTCAAAARDGSSLCAGSSARGGDTWEPEANLLPSLVREYLEHQEASAESQSEESEEEGEVEEEGVVQVTAAVTEREANMPQQQQPKTTGKRKQGPAIAPPPQPPKRVRPPPTVRARS